MALSVENVNSILRTARRQLARAGISELHEEVLSSVDEFMPDGAFADYPEAERRLINYLYALYRTLRSVDSETAERAMARLSNYVSGGGALSLKNAVLHWGNSNENSTTLENAVIDYSATLQGIRALMTGLGLPDPGDDGNDDGPASEGDGDGGDGPDRPSDKPPSPLTVFVRTLERNERRRKEEIEEETYEESREEQFVHVQE